jgi:hypothetical protein
MDKPTWSRHQYRLGAMRNIFTNKERLEIGRKAQRLVSMYLKLLKESGDTERQEYFTAQVRGRLREQLGVKDAGSSGDSGTGE